MATRRSLQLVCCLVLGLAVTAGCWGATVFEEREHVLDSARERVNGLAGRLEQQVARAALSLSALRALVTLRNGWVSEEIFVSYVRALALAGPAIDGLELAPDAILDFTTGSEGAPTHGGGDLLAQANNPSLLLDTIRQRQLLISDMTGTDGTRKLLLREAVFLPGRASRLDIPDFYGLVGVRLSLPALMQDSGIDPERHLLAQPGSGDALYALYGDSSIPAATSVQADITFRGHVWRIYERIDPARWWLCAESFLAGLAGLITTAMLVLAVWLIQGGGRRVQHRADEMEAVLGITATGWMRLLPSGALSLSALAARHLALPEQSSAQALLASVDKAEAMAVQRFLLETGSGGTSRLAVTLRPEGKGPARRVRLIAGPQDTDRQTLIAVQRLEAPAGEWPAGGTGS